MIRMVKKSQQRGAVLAIGLIILLVLTLVGTSGINSVRMEERMTANTQDAGMAFMGAEAGLVQCETDIKSSDSLSIESVSVPVNGYATIYSDGTVSRWWEDPDFWSDKNQRLENYESFATGTVVKLAEEPACVIEYIGDANPSMEFSEAVTNDSVASRKVYRITGFSYGATKKSYSVVESVYAN